MKPILILYATREGQTKRIAEHLAAFIRERDRPARVAEVARDAQPELNEYGAVILAASVHMGKHEGEMVQFVKSHREALERVPTLFLSTSMTEGSAESGNLTETERSQAHATAEQRIQDFFEVTGLRATAHKAVAGALLYTQYNWLLRLVMKHISKIEGVSTDTSRDREYTDWVALDRFVSSWLSQLPSDALAASGR